MWIWTGISGIILFKSSMSGPWAELGLISWENEIIAWLLSLCIIPVVVWALHLPRNNWAMSIIIVGMIVLALLGSLLLAEQETSELDMAFQVEGQEGTVLSNNQWVQREAHFFPSETMDLFSSFVIILSIALIVRFVQVARSRQLKEVQLERMLAESNLHLLKSQMHPHFIFNTLNTVSGLMEKDIDGAQKTLEDLGYLLRSSLKQSKKQEVPLWEELDFLNHYLDIERVRFQHPIELELEICEACREAAVPHMLLQPLIENAVQHGFYGLDQTGKLFISAHQEGSGLVLLIQDNGHGLQAPIQQGIGLELVQQRLEVLYENESLFSIESREEGGTRVLIRIPFRMCSSSIHLTDAH